MGTPIVTVKQGKVQGVVVNSVLDSSYIAFKGIPFAAPPIGDLRFKDPQPPLPWTGIKDTSEIAVPPCTQLFEIPPHDVIGDEDCLYLNVYTKSLDQSKPVMFWIHGGAFIVGTSNFENTRPDYLLTKDIVLVCAQYRLGAFGFLNLGHAAAPGNQGLKDLIAALEWVKENIANFGGDPKNVTVFGASAGASLTQHLMLSPRAKGLFHKAILQSGTAISPWSMNQSRPERSFRLATLLGKESTDPVEVVEFLRTVPAQDIARAQNIILSNEEWSSYNFPFAPCCDEVAENPASPKPIDESQEADIPVLVGHTSHEAIMFVKDVTEKTMSRNREFLPVHVRNLASIKNLSDSGIEQLEAAVKKFYFDGKPISKENVASLVAFLTDTYFGVPAMVVVENRLKKATAPTYFYKYSYVGGETTPTDLLVKRIMSGASHVDETAYLFYFGKCKTENSDPPAIGTKDRINLERMITLWTNFAATGDPTGFKNEFVKTTWKPVMPEEPTYLDIGDELEIHKMVPHILSSL